MSDDKYNIETIGEFANIPKKLLPEFKVVTNAGDFYHIASNGSNAKTVTIPVNVPRTYINRENNTILRISVAKSIQNCIIGVHGHKVVEKWCVNTEEYNIYKITPEVALRPSSNVVGDANETGEYWLVNYDGEHEDYHLDRIGTLVGVANYSGYCGGEDGNKKNRKTVTVFGLDLWEEAIYNKEVLKPGYYKITYTQPYNENRWSKTFNVNVAERGDKAELFSEYYAIERMDDYISLKRAIMNSNTLPF